MQKSTKFALVAMLLALGAGLYFYFKKPETKDSDEVGVLILEDSELPSYIPEMDELARGLESDISKFAALNLEKNNKAITYLERNGSWPDYVGSILDDVLANVITIEAQVNKIYNTDSNARYSHGGQYVRAELGKFREQMEHVVGMESGQAPQAPPIVNQHLHQKLGDHVSLNMKAANFDSSQPGKHDIQLGSTPTWGQPVDAIMDEVENLKAKDLAVIPSSNSAFNAAKDPIGTSLTFKNQPETVTNHVLNSQPTIDPKTKEFVGTVINHQHVHIHEAEKTSNTGYGGKQGKQKAIENIRPDEDMVSVEWNEGAYSSSAKTAKQSGKAGESTSAAEETSATAAVKKPVSNAMTVTKNTGSNDFDTQNSVALGASTADSVSFNRDNGGEKSDEAPPAKPKTKALAQMPESSVAQGEDNPTDAFNQEGSAFDSQRILDAKENADNLGIKRADSETDPSTAAEIKQLTSTKKIEEDPHLGDLEAFKDAATTIFSEVYKLTGAFSARYKVPRTKHVHKTAETRARAMQLYNDLDSLPKRVFNVDFKNNVREKMVTWSPEIKEAYDFYREIWDYVYKSAMKYAGKKSLVHRVLPDLNPLPEGVVGKTTSISRSPSSKRHKSNEGKVVRKRLMSVRRRSRRFRTRWL